MGILSRKRSTEPLLVVLIYSVIALALYLCAPGFLPKEVRNYALQFFSTERGTGLFFALLTVIPLMTTASIYRSQACLKSIMASCFALLALILALDFSVDLTLGPVIARWVLRIVWLALLGLSFFYRAVWIQSLKNYYSALKKSFATSAEPWRTFEKIALGLVLFFLFRQTFAFFYNRGAPFADELNFWHTASIDLLKGGFVPTIDRHSYTLAVPWLAALAGRIWNLNGPDVVYGYSCLVVFGSIFLVIELARSYRALLAGLSLLLLCFVIQRDLFSLYGASLYGEGLASLLTGVLVVEAFYLWKEPKPKAIHIFGLALLTGFATVSKPPLSYLAWLLPLFSIGRVLYQRKSIRNSLVWLVAGLLYFPWRGYLALQNKSTYYQSFDIVNALDKGIAFEIPLKMISGLLNHGTPQSAYTISLIIALLYTLVLKNYRLLQIYIGLIAIYWGFVFALYSTLWQHMEQFSAGRYISHAAIACVMLVPLAFLKESK